MQALAQNQATQSVKLLKARMRHSRIFAGLILAVMVFSTTRLNGNLFALKVMEWGGYALVITGVFIRIYASLYIGGRKNEELITDGPFSIVRNPLYVGSFIAVLGIGLQSTSLVIFLLLLAAFNLYYPFVIGREEAFLAQRFGQRYADYKASTPSVIPKFRLWHSSREFLCRPYFVMRTMRDGLVFYLALPLHDILKALHTSDILPILWVLP